MAETRIRTDRKKGIALALLSAASFGMMSIFVAMTRGHISVMEQTFFRNLIGFFLIGFVCYREHIPFYGERKYAPQLFARCFFGFMGVMCLFYATRNAAIADVTIVSRLDMFTITAVSAIFLHEKLGRWHYLAMAVAFTGAFIAANPRFDSGFLPLLGAFGTALCNTVSYPTMSYLAGRVNSLTIIMCFCTFSTLAAIPLMWSTFVLPTGWTLAGLLALGAFAASGQICLTYSYHYAPAGELSIYSQLSILINALLGLVFLGQVPSGRTILGGALVMTASIGLCIYKQRRKA